MANIELSDSERTRIAERLEMECASWDMACEEMKGDWDDHENMYQANTRARSAEIVEGMGGYAIPIWKPALDRLVNVIWSSIFGQRPAVQCIDVTGKAANVEALERTLDNLADKAGLELPAKRAIRSAGNTNLGTVCIRTVTGKDGKVEGLSASFYNPKRVMCHPVSAEGFADAKTFGYHAPEMVYRARKKQSEGVYYKDADVKGFGTLDDKAMGDDSGDVLRSDAAGTDDEPMNIWVLFSEMDIRHFRDDSNEEESETDGTKYERYMCVLDRDSSQLLAMEPYGTSGKGGKNYKPYEHAEMIEFKLVPEEDDGILSRYSMAYAMRGVQDCLSDCFTTIVQGNQMQAFPVVVMKGGGLASKYKKVKPGEVLTIDAAQSIEYLTTPFQSGDLPSIIEMLRMVADSLTLGRLGSGQALQGKRTATEVDVLADAIGEAKDSYTQAVAPSIARCYEVLYMYLRHHYTDLKAVYKDAIEIDKADLDNLSVRFEVTGKTGASNPSVLLRKLHAILQIVKENPQYGVDPRLLATKMLEALDLPFSVDSIMVRPADEILLSQGVAPGEIAAARALMAQVGQGGAEGGQVLGDAQGGEMGLEPAQAGY